MSFWEMLNKTAGMKGWIFPYFALLVLIALFIGNRIPKDRRRMVLSIILVFLSAIGLLISSAIFKYFGES